MDSDRDTIRRERMALKQKYGVLFSTVTDVLFELDPMGINLGSNTDEYEPEAGTILPRLEKAKSVKDVEVIVREELCRWFGLDDGIASNNFVREAARIWDAWCEFKQR